MIDAAHAHAPGRRERKKQETRAALAAAALRLAVEHGIENVSVEDISEAADVSVRTFFNYFPHKEHAVLGRDPEAGERIERRLREAPAELPPVAALRYALDEVLHDLVDGDPVAWSQRAALVAESPSLLSHLVLTGAADERRLAAVLAERLGPPGDPATALPAALVVTSVGGAVRVALEQRGMNPDGPSMHVLLDTALAQLAAGFDHLPSQPGRPAPDPDPREHP